MKSVLDALLANLSLTPERCTSLYVMYGYDCSVPEAVMRMSSVLSVQAVTVSWADLDSDNQTADHHLKIANFVKRGNRQVMKKLLSEKTFILDGYQKADAMIEDTPRPTYTESDYKLICPVASGHLPLRAEWLELYSQKYTEEDIKEQFQALVDEHNKVHNPDGQPHKASGRKRTASAAGLLDQSQETSADTPEGSSAPKNVAELTAKDGPISMITVRGQQFHFTKTGHLWIHGTSDDILPRGLCVALIFGKFFINEHVQAENGSLVLVAWIGT